MYKGTQNSKSHLTGQVSQTRALARYLKEAIKAYIIQQPVSASIGQEIRHALESSQLYSIGEPVEQHNPHTGNKVHVFIILFGNKHYRYVYLEANAVIAICLIEDKTALAFYQQAYERRDFFAF